MDSPAYADLDWKIALSNEVTSATAVDEKEEVQVDEKEEVQVDVQVDEKEDAQVDVQVDEKEE